MLQEDIQSDLKDALKSGDDLRLSVLRDIKSGISNELISEGQTPQDSLSDEEVMAVIARLTKQRREAIEEFKAGDRDELADKEQKELEILESYLPDKMSDEELETLIEEKIAETGAEGMSDMGQVMGAVMSEVGPATDGNDVREIVQEKLQS